MQIGGGSRGDKCAGVIIRRRIERGTCLDARVDSRRALVAVVCTVAFAHFDTGPGYQSCQRYVALAGLGSSLRAGDPPGLIDPPV